MRTQLGVARAEESTGQAHCNPSAIKTCSPLTKPNFSSQCPMRPSPPPRCAASALCSCLSLSSPRESSKSPSGMRWRTGSSAQSSQLAGNAGGERGFKTRRAATPDALQTNSAISPARARAAIPAGRAGALRRRHYPAFCPRKGTDPTIVTRASHRLPPRKKSGVTDP